MKLYSPLALLLLLLLPVLAYLMVRKKGTAAVRFPSLGELRNCPASWRLRFRPVLVAARLVCLGLLIVARARPREETVLSEVSTEGVAIEAVVDHSGSMQTEMDYYGDKQNRLDVVKKVLAAFISGDNKAFAGRASDLIGLVTFARYADTTCPLVLGHDVLLEFLDETEIVRLRSEDGTAIGDAIALAAARLRKAEEEMSRVLSDAKRKSEWEAAGIIAEAKQRAEQIINEARKGSRSDGRGEVEESNKVIAKAKQKAQQAINIIEEKDNKKSEPQDDEMEIMLDLPHNKRINF